MQLNKKQKTNQQQKTTQQKKRMIKKITPQELEKMRLRRLGKKHPVRKAIEDMAPGDIIQIPLADFKWKKRTPTFFTNEISKASNKQYVVSKIHNNGGWVVQRIDDAVEE